MLVAGLILTVGAMLTASGAATVPVSTIHFVPALRIWPGKVPASRSVPVVLHIGGKLRMEDYSRVPELRELDLRGDRHVELDLAGPPTCPVAKLPTGPLPAKRCAEAIVGRGHVTLETAFPENRPMTNEFDLAVYNGGSRNGTSRLWIYGYSSPVDRGPFYVPVKIDRIDEGRYGWKAVASLPPVYGGHGSITALDLTLQRRILSAACPDGHLVAKVRSTFADGTVLQSSTEKDCR